MNPFSSGNKELIAEAKRNPIKSNDDLLPSYWEQVEAAFDQSYYRTGAGIDNKIIEEFDKRQPEIIQRMKETGYNEDQIHLYGQFYHPYTLYPEIIFPERFGEIKDERVLKAVEIHNNVLQANDNLMNDDDLEAKVRSFVKGEVKNADQVAKKSDSITASLIGGFGGVLTDPAVLGTVFLPLGQEAFIAKSGSIVSSILKKSAIEGALGATGEALTIPQQKQNRAFLGEKFSNWDAAKNVAAAGAGGFLLSALGRSGLETFKYIKELRRGVADAEKIAIKSTDQKAGIRQMNDVSYTANRALDGDEFPPLHGKDITPEQYVKHMDDSRIAYEEAYEWGRFENTGSYDEILPTAKSDVLPRVDDDSFYKDILTEADRAYDNDLFKQAGKIDAEIPVGIRLGEEGETIIDVKPYKTITKELDDELSGLEAVSMCMRGSK